jgi:hypothetical protein
VKQLTELFHKSIVRRDIKNAKEYFMKKIFGFGRMRALVALLCGVFVFLTLGACASTSKVYKRGSASANGEIIGTVETDLSLYIPVYYQWEVDKLLGEAHKVLLTEARKQYKGNIDVDDIVFGKRKFLLSFFIPAGGYVQSIKLTGNVFLTKYAPPVTAPSPSTGASAIPAQAAQPAPVVPLVQLPLEKIFVGGNPPQGTRDDYAAVLPAFNDALDWLDIYTRDGGNYAIVLGSDQTANNVVLEYANKRVTVSLAVSGGGRTVKSAGNKSLFTVGYDVTFTLEDGVTLFGADGGGEHLVAVGSGGTFIMNGGTIRGDSTSKDSGVYVSGTAQAIRGVSASDGRSFVTGTFTMKGGTISGNSARGDSADTSRYVGGGVRVGGTFTMEGGTISGNTASRGGGVSVAGTFTMKGGTISGNTASRGGGVSVDSYGTSIPFTMNGGTISGNSAVQGGGVYVDWDGIFTMNGGDISGNSVAYNSNWVRDGDGNGGGVYVGGRSGTFNLNGGTIGGNSASINGGGVYVAVGRTFTKSGTGGIIYGSNAPARQVNKAKSDEQGHAVYIDGTRPQKRTTTAGETTALDSTKNLVQGGGWE